MNHAKQQKRRTVGADAVLVTEDKGKHIGEQESQDKHELLHGLPNMTERRVLYLISGTATERASPEIRRAIAGSVQRGY